MRLFHGGALALLLVLGACLPVEEIVIPEGVDWFAYIGPTQPGIETGRLYRPGETTLPASTAAATGWLLGYAEQDLVQSGIPQTILRRLILRPARDAEILVPSPVWSYALSGAGDVPGITIDEYANARPLLGSVGFPLNFTTIDLESDNVNGDTPSTVVGRSDSGSLLLADQTHVYRITESQVGEIGVHNCSRPTSIAEVEGTFWLVSSHEVCRGAEISSLSVHLTADERYCFDGTLYSDSILGLLYFSYRGISRTSIKASGTYFAECPHPDLLVKRMSDHLIAAWPFRGTRTGPFGEFEYLSIRRPFGISGESILFDGADGTLREFNENSTPLTTVLTSGPAGRPFDQMTDILGFRGGAFVLQKHGRLSWVNSEGIAVDFMQLEHDAYDLRRVGDGFVMFAQPPGERRTVVYLFSPSN